MPKANSRIIWQGIPTTSTPHTDTHQLTNPYKFNEPICIAFSGGRSSAYMLRKILDAGLPAESRIVFCNTGKEEEATLEFVRDCADQWKMPIVWLEYRNSEEKFAVVDFESASRNGEPFEALIRKKKYLPNPVTRFCTSELKIRITAQYCKSIGLDAGEEDSIVGFRYDEPARVAKLKDKSRAPMYHAKAIKKDIIEFWRTSPFDLALSNINGVTPNGNCDLCFMKGQYQNLSLVIQKPSRADWWAHMETLIRSEGVPTSADAAVFRADRPSYAAMKKFSINQLSLFDPNEESINCFCGD